MTPARLQQLVQPHVPVPVRAVGVVQPAGTWGAMGVGRASPAVGRLMRRRAGEAAGGPTRTVFRTKTALCALTDETLYLLNAKPRAASWDVLGIVGSWRRDDLVISATPGALATKVRIDVTRSDERFEMEATTVGDNGVTEVFIGELLRSQSGGG